MTFKYLLFQNHIHLQIYSMTPSSHLFVVNSNVRWATWELTGTAFLEKTLRTGIACLSFLLALPGPLLTRPSSYGDRDGEK